MDPMTTSAKLLPTSHAIVGCVPFVVNSKVRIVVTKRLQEKLKHSVFFLADALQRVNKQL